MTVKFAVPGRPATKGSVKLIGRRVIPDNPRLAGWTTQVRYHAVKAMQQQRLWTGDVEIAVDFWIKRSMDLDKMLRALLDALTSVVYLDDRQVIDIRARKFITDHTSEGTVITATHMAGASHGLEQQKSRTPARRVGASRAVRKTRSTDQAWARRAGRNSGSDHE